VLHQHQTEKNAALFYRRIAELHSAAEYNSAIPAEKGIETAHRIG